MHGGPWVWGDLRRMRVTLRLLAIAAATLGMGGCGGAGEPATVPSTGMSTVTSASSASSAPSVSSAAPTRATVISRTAVATAGDSQGSERNVITFRVEGGFSGQLRELTIEPDGAASATVSGRQSSGQVGVDQVAAIRQALDASGLFSGDHTYPPGQGADLQRYTIGYHGATVVAYDTTVPPSLTEAVSLLQKALHQIQT